MATVTVPWARPLAAGAGGIGEQHVDGDVHGAAHARKARPVADAVDDEVADGAGIAGGAAALKAQRRVNGAVHRPRSRRPASCRKP